ncbi:MAG: hypothetical protein KAQ83_03910, partial [Nanoarchaeota archaeon]|nr:hypothetical protein [Nanoarchaeota archaeon]
SILRFDSNLNSYVVSNLNFGLTGIDKRMYYTIKDKTKSNILENDIVYGDSKIYFNVPYDNKDQDKILEFCFSHNEKDLILSQGICRDIRLKTGNELFKLRVEPKSLFFSSNIYESDTQKLTLINEGIVEINRLTFISGIINDRLSVAIYEIDNPNSELSSLKGQTEKAYDVEGFFYDLETYQDTLSICAKKWTEYRDCTDAFLEVKIPIKYTSIQ